MSDTAIQAHLWRSRGYKVLPAQPGEKLLVTGYGPYLQDLATAKDIEFWFRTRHANLCVVCPPDAVILDFDDPELYARFLTESPAGASYAEKTPRGGFHVFLAGEGGSVPSWDSCHPGLEIKKSTLAYPSVINGKQYKPVKQAKILRVNLEDALRGFATVKVPDPERSPRVALPGVPQGQNTGIIARVKGNWPILSYLAFFGYDLKLTGQGRWRSGLCPFHPDRHPSFWLDTERNLWGCHAENLRGDVVNFHARRLNTSDMGKAAQDLESYNVTFYGPGDEHV